MLLSCVSIDGDAICFTFWQYHVCRGFALCVCPIYSFVLVALYNLFTECSPQIIIYYFPANCLISIDYVALLRVLFQVINSWSSSLFSVLDLSFGWFNIGVRVRLSLRSIFHIVFIGSPYTMELPMGKGRVFCYRPANVKVLGCGAEPHRSSVTFVYIPKLWIYTLHSLYVCKVDVTIYSVGDTLTQAIH